MGLCYALKRQSRESSTDRDLGRYIPRDEDEAFKVEEKISGDAPLIARSHQQEVQDLLESIEATEDQIHLGEAVHDTMVKYAQKMQDEKREFGGILFLTEEGKILLSGEVKGDKPEEGEEFGYKITIPRYYSEERGDPPEAEDAAPAGTAHTHPRSGIPDPSLGDLHTLL